MERRTWPVALELRQEPDEVARIVGRAIVYDSQSEDLGGFREVIRPGALKGALRGDRDVVALWQHQSDKPLGRQSNGTLALRDTAEGLEVEIIPPDTSWGKDAMVSIGRGDVRAFSFGFEVPENGEEYDGKNRMRYITDLVLHEVSPVTFPAYPETSAAVRDWFALQAQSDPVVDMPVDDRARARRAARRRKIEIAERENRR